MINLNNEVWKDVPDFEGHYQISNFGRVRSILTSQGTYRERLRKTYLDRNGYENVDLWKLNKQYKQLVHRLVAKAFIPNPENKPTINHIDGIKHNNDLRNLEWVTQSENLVHASETGLIDKEACKQRMLGTKSKNSKSSYHNVSYDNSRNKWIASIKIDRKTTGSKRFDNEIDAAKHVNYLLDLHNLTDRPRNNV